MVNFCCVTGCKNEYYPGFSFHRFPRDESLREKWSKVVPGKLSKTSLVCSKHFKVEDYHSTPRKIFKSNAIPSIFPKNKLIQMVMVTRSSHRKACASYDSSDLSHNNEIRPPWCSGKVYERKKPRKVASPTWEIRSSYPLRENIWEYLREDKKNFCHKRKNSKACCKQIPPKNKAQRKTVILPAFMFIAVAMIAFLWFSNNNSDKNMMSTVFPRTKLISMFGLEPSTSVDEECCYRMKHLSAELLRAEEALRSALRLRKTMMLTSETTKAVSEPSNAIDGGYISGAWVTKGSGTKAWGGRVALWGIVPLWRAAPPPDTVLVLRRPTPSDCWPFSGSYGELIIDLPHKLGVRCISIEHVRPDTALSAPKHFTLYGVLENGTLVKAVDGEYRNNGPAKQYYTMLYRHIPMKRMIFRILSNQGNPRYTCVYRVHLYKSYE